MTEHSPGAATASATGAGMAEASSARPAARYTDCLASPGFTEDSAQAACVAALDDLWERITAPPPRQGLLDRLRKRTPEPVQGLYLWGGVGRGKTFLMDLFHDCLPPGLGLRMHFHRCMQRVHLELRDLAGRANPMQEVAARLAGECRVLCFDEFFVSDIGDAMILAELLDGLFARGVSLVATSNIAPSDLYANGLQRSRFLPAIALLERHCQILNVDGGTDYRLRALEQAELYYHPLDDGAEASLERSFLSLVPDTPEPGKRIEVLGRTLTTRWCADDVAWFDFTELCDGPRSAQDYIQLAREFHAVVISAVPRFTTDTEDQARRFINLVDEFYDRGVKLVLSADAPIPDLYDGQRLSFEFERTASRLLEMQSHDYLARGHRA